MSVASNNGNTFLKKFFNPFFLSPDIGLTNIVRFFFSLFHNIISYIKKYLNIPRSG